MASTLMAASMACAVLHWMRIALAVWCSLSSLEALVALRAFRADQPLGRGIAALRRDRTARWVLASPLASEPALTILPLLRLGAGLALPFAGGALGIALPAVIVVTTAAIAMVGGGSDGADKIALVALVAVLLIATGLRLDDPRLCLAGVIWATGQLTIAYVAAGAAKLAKPFWRDGSAIAAVMTSHRWGHSLSAAVVRHPGPARALAWTVMLPELFFPLALFAPPVICLAVLAGFAAFHLATAIVMGLNTYPWAFVATYPCVWAANHLIRHALGC